MKAVPVVMPPLPLLESAIPALSVLSWFRTSFRELVCEADSADGVPKPVLSLSIKTVVAPGLVGVSLVAVP